MKKGIIYYTDNKLEEPLFSIVQQRILDVGLPIVSSSLEFMDFGKNVHLIGQRTGYFTMIKQIILALEHSEGIDTVFFCEHDVLYHPSHFEFTPSQDDIFYYNDNVWRWKMTSDKVISYRRMLPLSCLCVNREFALKHYRLRHDKVVKEGWDKITNREPWWARRMGYEPGTKKRRRGGITDDDFETWTSAFPNIDVRHSGTFSRSKVGRKEFKHLPEDWREIPVKDIPGWDLIKLFNI